MNRLQKKCLVAATGTHLLLVVALLCSGFVRSKPQPDESQVLTMIPTTIIDATFTTGKREAQPPPPTPVVTPPAPVPPPETPPPPPQPEPIEPPKPVETVKQPEPETETEKPDDLPTPKPPKKRETHEVKPELKLVTRPTPKMANSNPAEDEREAQKEAKAARDRAKAFNKAISTIREKTPASTTVDLPGDSTEAYASYASIVKTVYTEAWILPENADNDEANVKVSVTIANNGRVTDAHIVEPSGDANLDRSVQRTLDRVTDLKPFPDGATDKQRTYIINFNLKAKRQLLG